MLVSCRNEIFLIVFQSIQYNIMNKCSSLLILEKNYLVSVIGNPLPLAYPPCLSVGSMACANSPRASS